MVCATPRSPLGRLGCAPGSPLTGRPRTFRAYDSTRAASPLAKAPDAVEIDGTHLTLDQVVDAIVALVDDVTPAGTP